MEQLAKVMLGINSSIELLTKRLDHIEDPFKKSPDPNFIPLQGIHFKDVEHPQSSTGTTGAYGARISRPSWSAGTGAGRSC